MPSEASELEPAFRLGAARAAMQAATQTVAVAYALNIAETEAILSAVLSDMRGDLVKHMALKHIEAAAAKESTEEAM